MGRRQSSEVQASRSEPRGRRTGCYLGWLLDMEQLSSRGGAWVRGGRASDLGRGEGWAEAVKRNFCLSMEARFKILLLAPMPFTIINFLEMARLLDTQQLWLFPRSLMAFNWTTEK